MADKPHITPEGYVARLVQVGVWATPQNPIQYAFLEKKPSYLPNEAGWAPLSAVQRAAVQTAFAVIAEIVNLTFVQVADNQLQPGTGNSRIAFYANSIDVSYSGSMYSYQNDGSPLIYGADIRFNTTRIAQRQANEGFSDFMPFVALHEVLHSMGLSHPGNYNGQGFNYQDHAEFAEDTVQYSVMSYFSAASSGADHTLGNVLYAARTPLLYDILALQSLYAPNMSTRAGDTVYGFNSNTGAASPFNFAVTTGPVVAIWDGGGTDTLDLSGYSDASKINLGAGEFSDAGGLTKNIAIAFGVTIENAVGGAGDDVIRGNPVANRLEGGVGNDMLFGGDGADLLIGGAGADQLEGGAGADRFLYVAAGHSAAAAVDAIADFEVGVDKIDLSQIDTGPEAGDQDFLWIGSAAFSGKGTAQLRVVNVGGSQWRVEGDLDGNGTADFALTVTTVGGQALTAKDIAGVTVIPEPVYIGDDTDNVINGSAGHDSLEGRGGNDILNGGDGNDLLDGGTGADRMTGGTGNDLYIVDDPGDEAVEAAGEGIDEIRTPLASFSIASLGNIENLTGTSAASQTLTGNNLGNLIVGGMADDTLLGGAGNDVLVGFGGSDILRGEAGDDVYVIDAGDTIVELPGDGLDEVRTQAEIFVLSDALENLRATTDIGHDFRGNAGNNVILGGDGKDIIRAEAGGGDLLFGKGGDDAFYFGAAFETNDFVDGGAGTDTLILQGNYDLTPIWTITGGTSLTDVETLTLLGGSVATYGDAGGQLYSYRLTMTDANVAAGRRLSVDASSLGVGETLTFLGTAESDGAFDITGGGGDDSLIGGARNDTIIGGGGADALTGGGGADMLRGGSGADRFVYTAASDSTNASLDRILDFEAGIDKIDLSAFGRVQVSFSQGSDAATGAAFTLLTADAGAFALVIRIDGAASGADIIGELAIFGTANDDVLVGSAQADEMFGGDGNDMLDSRGGADRMDGGKGNDIYVVDVSDDEVVEAPGEGIDEVRTALASFSLASLANVENLTGASAASQTLTGNGLGNLIIGGMADDELLGGGGNDVLVGFGGSDILRGQAGDDVYVIDAADTIVELPGDGLDEVRTQAEIFVLSDALENLRATTDIGHDFRGNGGNNVIIAGDGKDIIRAEAGGGDLLFGKGGDDAFYFGAAFETGDFVDGGAGSDTVIFQGDYHLTPTWTITGGTSLTDVEKLELLGGSIATYGDTSGGLYSYDLTMTDANVAAGRRLLVDASSLGAGETLTFLGTAESDGAFDIVGGAGNDTLAGGLRNDTLTGGGGSDIFKYAAPAESTTAARDVIRDFAGGDRIDLAAIDADGSSANGDTAFTFIGAAAFQNAAGQLRAFENPAASGTWFVEGDVNGDGVADLSIQVIVADGHALVAADFNL